MLIDIVKLKSGVVDKVDIDEQVVFTDENLKNSGILELNEVFARGYIIKDSIDSYNLNLRIYGTMVLPCSISFKPTEYPFDIEIDGNIENLLEEIGESSKKTQNTIDIFPIIWENILMEIPMRVVNPDLNDVKTEGDGWQLVTEEKKNNVNPELQKLADLFNEK